MCFLFVFLRALSLSRPSANSSESILAESSESELEGEDSSAFRVLTSKDRFFLTPGSDVAVDFLFSSYSPSEASAETSTKKLAGRVLLALSNWPMTLAYCVYCLSGSAHMISPC